ncbi:MAG: septation protein spoVG [Caldiserica bacterium]|nr:MAG: septation protein spoVG [Caldisericota bacterium]
MEITSVKVYPRREQRVRAFAEVTFDNEFVVKNLRIIQGRERIFVAMPSRKKKDGSHEDVAHPITNELRQRIEKKILEEYNRIMAEREERRAGQQQSPSQ